MKTGTPTRTLDDHRAEFARNRFLAMPIAGSIAWLVIGVCGALLPVGLAAWVLFIATGSIFGLGLLIARWTGEDLLGKTRPDNALVVVAWYLFPGHRFVVIPAVIVLIYLVTIYVLLKRPKKVAA